ncbi:MAG: methyltransferase domain-containing protein [Anaerolineae bacterium]|nr:methyltransferase domain-containing protein [Anaerolineae bacterium]
MTRRMALSKPCRIIIGANGKPRGDWILTEIYNLNILAEADWKRYFQEGTIDALLAEHVWEHLRLKEGQMAACLCFRYLKPGGYIRVAVPDGFFPSVDYIDFVRPGGVGPGADDHKVLYTYKTLSEVFESAGFTVELLEYWDEHGVFYGSEWDTDGGMIMRSMRFAKRTFRCHDGKEHNYTSILLDARR